LSNKTKITLLTILLTLFILGATILGPKFINNVQMQFGFKGKIDLIEQCLKTKGCAISPDDLDLYTIYKKLEESEEGKRLKETKLGKSLEKEKNKSSTE